MPVCTKCGAINDRTAASCRRCGRERVGVPLDYDHWWERPLALFLGVGSIAVSIWLCWDLAFGVKTPLVLLRATYIALSGAGWIAFAVKRVRRRTAQHAAADSP